MSSTESCGGPLKDFKAFQKGPLEAVWRAIPRGHLSVTVAILERGAEWLSQAGAAGKDSGGARMTGGYSGSRMGLKVRVESLLKTLQVPLLGQ